MATSDDHGARTVHTVAFGETLDGIAAEHYGAADQWGRIAAANGIEDPMVLRPGTVLEIPKRLPDG